jgi:phosphoribosylglycinamide formyltransferase-1
VTIHAVDEIYDHGPVIAQRSVPLESGDTADSLEARITALEPAFFVETLRRIADGDLILPD